MDLQEGFREEMTFEVGLIRQAVFELSQVGSPFQAGGTSDMFTGHGLFKEWGETLCGWNIAFAVREERT